MTIYHVHHEVRSLGKSSYWTWSGPSIPQIMNLLPNMEKRYIDGTYMYLVAAGYLSHWLSDLVTEHRAKRRRNRGPWPNVPRHADCKRAFLIPQVSRLTMCDVFDFMFNLACCFWANKLVYANKLDSCHGTTWQSLVARSLLRYATRLGSKPLAVICKMLSRYANLIFALGGFEILNRASAMPFNFTSHVFSNLGHFIPGHRASIIKEAVLFFSSC